MSVPTSVKTERFCFYTKQKRTDLRPAFLVKNESLIYKSKFSERKGILKKELWDRT